MIDVAGQRQQAFALRLGLCARCCAEQHAVILIGMQSLLLASFAAKAQPTERDARIAVCLQAELDDTTHRVIVEQGDDPGDLAGGCAVCQHAVDQLVNVAAQVTQPLDTFGLTQRAGQVHQVDPLQREQVPLGYNANQLAIIDQTNVCNMPPGHCDGCVERAGGGGERSWLRCHYGRDAVIQVSGIIGNQCTQVAQRENARRRLLWIYDDDTADPCFMHLLDCIANAGLWWAADRFAPDQAVQPGIQGVMRSQGFARLFLSLLIDLF